MKTLHVLFLIFLGTLLLAQDLKLDVDGHSKIVGRLDLAVDNTDTSSLVIGRKAGISLPMGGETRNTFVGHLSGNSNLGTGVENSFLETWPALIIRQVVRTLSSDLLLAK